MKKRLYYYISFVLVSAFVMGTLSIEAKIELQKIKTLNDRFNGIKKMNQEFKKAAEEYDSCVQKRCGNEIEAIKKIGDEMSKAAALKGEIRQHLSHVKEKAEESLNVCTMTYCREVKDHFYKSRRNYYAAIGATLGTVVTVAIGAGALAIRYATRQSDKEAQEYRRIKEQKAKETKENQERKIDELMDKYGIKRDPESYRILNLYFTSDYRSGLRIFDKRLLWRLTLPLLKAMAEIYFQKSDMLPDEFDIFINEFAMDNRIHTSSLRTLREKTEEAGLQ